MAKGDQQVTVVGKYVDNISGPIKKTANNVKSSMQGASSGMAKTDIASSRLGKSLTRFNEKTERTRQVLMMTGTQLGGFAGQATYTAGSLGAVVGGMSNVEKASAGMIVVLAAVAYGIKKAFDEMNDSIKSASKHVGAMQKTTSELRKSLRDDVDEIQRMTAGMEKWEWQTRDNNEAMGHLAAGVDDMTDKLLQAQLDIVNTMEMNEGGFFSGLRIGLKALSDVEGSIDKLHKIENLKQSIRARREEIKQRKQQNELLEQGSAAQARLNKKKEEEARIEQQRKRNRKVDKFQEEIDAWIAREQKAKAFGRKLRGQIKQEQEQRLTQIRADKALADARARVAKDAEQGLTDITRENEARRTKIRQHELQKQAQIQEEFTSIAGGAMRSLLDDGLAGMLEYISDLLKAKAFEAAAHALWYAAQAVGFYATYQYPQAAAATSAAAQFAAFAALYGAGGAALGAIASSAKGGRGGGSNEETSEGGPATQAESMGQTELNRHGFIINVYGHQIIGRDGDRELFERVRLYREGQYPGSYNSSF